VVEKILLSRNTIKISGIGLRIVLICRFEVCGEGKPANSFTESKRNDPQMMGLS
jgi:hypothetical protein